MNISPAEITKVHDRYLELTLDATEDLDETLTPIIRECGKEPTLAAIERTCRTGKITVWKDLHIAALQQKLLVAGKPATRHEQPAPRASDSFKAPAGWQPGVYQIMLSYAGHHDTLRYCDELEEHHRKHGVLREDWLRGLNEIRARAHYNREHNIKPGLRVQEFLIEGE